MKSKVRNIRRFHKRRMKEYAKRVYWYDPKFYRYADNMRTYRCCSLCKFEKEFKLSRRDLRQYEALSSTDE